MPAAIAVPIGLAVAGMVASNVQQKSAQSNNSNQQQQSVANAQNAYNTAKANENAWIAGNPAPTNTIGRPGSPLGSSAIAQAPPMHAAPVAGPVNPSAVLSGAGASSAGSATSVAPIIQQILSSMQNGGGARSGGML